MKKKETIKIKIDKKSKKKLDALKKKKAVKNADNFTFMRYQESSCGCIYMDRG